MRKRSREELTSIPKIYEEERMKLLSGYEDDTPQEIAAKLSMYGGIKSGLYRQRAKKVPKTPQAAMDLHLEGEWTMTEMGGDFVIVDDVRDGSRILVFGTLSDLTRLCNSDTASMDGTFKICPKIFYQLYVIHSHQSHGSVPELFCLLPDKKTSTYHRLISLLKLKAADLELKFDPTTLIVDFEVTVHNVVRDLLPTTNIKGCLFHFGQALYRNLQGLGLASLYKTSDDVRKWFRMYIGLAFLPVAHVVEGYNLVVAHTPDVSQCYIFNQYFNNTWINGQFPLSVWNHFRSDNPRTNNSCEGYNSRLSKRAMKPHLNIYELILLFKSENANKEAHLLQIESEQKQTKRRRVREDRDKLFQLGLDYVTCNRSMAAYLSACGAVLAGTFPV
jgi:hypothetical protein